MLPAPTVDLEELTLNAWPSLQRVLYDGWVLGFSDGYTRRANSINPLYPGSRPLDEKIRVCQAAYADRNQAAVFKVSSRAPQAALDRALDRLGYTAAAETSVQAATLSARAWPADADDVAGMAISITTRLDDAWLADFARLSATPERFLSPMRGMLGSIAPPHAFARLAHDGRALGLGLAVLERGYIGLFDVVVDPSVRNQGLGRRVVTSLLAWGRHLGAQHAYLAVVADNAPAVHLYARLGFAEQYRYWYRLAPPA